MFYASLSEMERGDVSKLARNIDEVTDLLCGDGLPSKGRMSL